MQKSRIAIAALFLALFALNIVTSVHAQTTGAVARISFYLAADSNGTQQVYQYLLDGQSQPRQITHAKTDVINFGVAYDGLGVAYVSAGKLWLQPIHTDSAEALASLSAVQFLSGPIWSQDGQYLAYPDKGVWLLDMATRKTRQILTDVPIDDKAPNTDKFRLFAPKLFVSGADGKAAKLVVDVGIWEWSTPGVYDLASGKLQELGGLLHTNLLPLQNGQALLYGNGGVAGEPALHIADSLDDINTYKEVFKFDSLGKQFLFADQAVEIKPGIVRLFGSTIDGKPDQASAFYFDFDVTKGTTGGLKIVALTNGNSDNTVTGQLSPDGALVPVYLNVRWTDAGSIYGGFRLVDLATGEAVAATFPKTVGVFRWLP